MVILGVNVFMGELEHRVAQHCLC